MQKLSAASRRASRAASRPKNASCDSAERAQVSAAYKQAPAKAAHRHVRVLQHALVQIQHAALKDSEQVVVWQTLEHSFDVPARSLVLG